MGTVINGAREDADCEKVVVSRVRSASDVAPKSRPVYYLLKPQVSAFPMVNICLPAENNLNPRTSILLLVFAAQTVETPWTPNPSLDLDTAAIAADGYVPMPWKRTISAYVCALARVGLREASFRADTAADCSNYL